MAAEAHQRLQVVAVRSRRRRPAARRSARPTGASVHRVGNHVDHAVEPWRRGRDTRSPRSGRLSRTRRRRKSWPARARRWRASGCRDRRAAPSCSATSLRSISSIRPLIEVGIGELRGEDQVRIEVGAGVVRRVGELTAVRHGRSGSRSVRVSACASQAWSSRRAAATAPFELFGVGACRRETRVLGHPSTARSEEEDRAETRRSTRSTAGFKPGGLHGRESMRNRERAALGGLSAFPRLFSAFKLCPAPPLPLRTVLDSSGQNGARKHRPFRKVPKIVQTQEDRPIAAPRDALEDELVALWQELLGVGPVSIYDDFFDLGGHSLLAAAMVARVAERFDRSIPVALLLENPTLAGFADAWSEIPARTCRMLSRWGHRQPAATLFPARGFQCRGVVSRRGCHAA